VSDLVSVIVPNYNHADFLEERIQSILGQRYQNFELILLDDASTDKSRTVIEKFRHEPKVSSIVFNTENSGSTFAQWKRGIDLVKGSLIWIAESDDYAHPDFLQQCVKKFAGNLKLQLVQTNSAVVDETSSITKPDLNWWFSNVDAQRWTRDFEVEGVREIKEGMTIQNNIPNASAVVFRKDFFNEVLDFKLAGDWFFWIKMLELGDYAFISEPLNFFRTHSNTTRNYSFAKSKLLLQELTRIFNYLSDKKLITEAHLKVKQKEILNSWATFYKATDMFSGDFFIPFSPRHLPFFVSRKIRNGFSNILKSSSVKR
jgi:glycosyltransferase involved in cell wall biosynthesis